MTATKKHDLTPALNRHGRQMFADGGTSRGASRPMKRCGDCGTYVAWVQNADERWYLVDCCAYGNQDRDGKHYYRADRPHRCEPQVESVEQAHQRRKAEMWRWRDERDEQGIETTRDESLAYLAMLKARDEAKEVAR